MKKRLYRIGAMLCFSTAIIIAVSFIIFRHSNGRAISPTTRDHGRRIRKIPAETGPAKYEGKYAGYKVTLLEELVGTTTARARIHLQKGRWLVEEIKVGFDFRETGGWHRIITCGSLVDALIGKKPHCTSAYWDTRLTSWTEDGESKLPKEMQDYYWRVEGLLESALKSVRRESNLVQNDKGDRLLVKKSGGR